MKVLVYSSNNIEWGGSEELWEKECLDLNAQGHTVFASTFSFENKKERLKLLEKSGVQVQHRERIPIPNGNRPIQAFKNYLKFKKNKSPNNPNWKEILNFNPDKAIFNLGELFEEDILFQYQSLKEYIVGKVSYELIVHFVSDEFPQLTYNSIEKFREIFNGSHRVRFVSDSNAESAKRQLGLYEMSYELLKNQASSTYDLSSIPFTKKLILACVARLEHQTKGQDIILDYVSNYPLKNQIHINFYGSGESEFHLKRLVDYYDLNEVVTFKGFVMDKKKIWSENHILLLMSKDEGLPLSLIEAAQFGKTFISSNAGGVRDIDEQIGYKFNVSNEGEFHEFLNLILNYPDSLNAKSINCKHWIKKYFAD